MQTDISRVALMTGVLVAVISAFAQQQPAGSSGTVGSAVAPITLVVFSDFESFSCARSASVLADLLDENKDIRMILKHAPAASNLNAILVTRS